MNFELKIVGKLIIINIYTALLLLFVKRRLYTTSKICVLFENQSALYERCQQTIPPLIRKTLNVNQIVSEVKAN